MPQHSSNTRSSGDRPDRSRHWRAVTTLLLATLAPTALAQSTFAPAAFTPAAPAARGDTPADEPSGTIAASIRALGRSDLNPLSSVSCGASSCHGGPQPGVASPAMAGDSAYGLWLQHDPHSRSWRTLCSPASIAMLTRLGILDDGQLVDPAGWDNCLACHNTSRLDSGPAASPLPLHTEGVGCASCHGPAERWIHQHYLADWRPEQAIDSGFVPASNLVTRARMCASCHVGDRDRDMNHDLIAAGHPALRFEMASHHSRLPKHWRDADEDDPAALQAALWTAGAIASADAWLALQQGRAGGTTAASTWPEFATYDCSSCHHGLQLGSSRDPLADQHRRGAAKLAGWDLAAMNLWAHALRNRRTAKHNDADDWSGRFDSLRQRAQQMPAPEPDDMLRALGDVRHRLPAWLESHAPDLGHASAARTPGGQTPGGQTPPRLLELLRSVDVHSDVTATWERAAQLYLMLAASEHEWPRAARTRQSADAEKLRAALGLPPGLDSPRYLLPSPPKPSLSREQTRRLFKQLIDALGAPPHTLRSPNTSRSSKRLSRSPHQRTPVTLTGSAHVVHN